ncbi:MAG: hypothetical protein ACJA1S_000465 [Cellvibrionaceae bacterium]
MQEWPLFREPNKLESILHLLAVTFALQLLH